MPLELGDPDLTQQVALVTGALDDQALQQQMQQAIALKNQSAAAPAKTGGKYLLYGVLGCACVGYWALNRAERRA